MYLEIYSKANIKFSAICLQETWLSDEADTRLLQLDGYTLIHIGKRCSSHGGVAIYLDNTYNFNVLNIHGNPEIWDGLFINRTLPRLKGSNKSLIIGNIYRPPRDNTSYHETFIKEIDEILVGFQQNKCEAVITGDFNLDLLKFKEKNSINSFLETVISNGFLPKITLPTRLGSSNTGTLIDNSFVKISDNCPNGCAAGVLINDLSDHLPYFISIF